MGSGQENAKRVLAVLSLAVATGVAGVAGGEDSSCAPPAVADRDADGNPYCAQPDISCYDDHPPTYGGNGQWICRPVEEVQAEQRYREAPTMTCPDGAVYWNADSGDWACEQLTECQSCQRCLNYVQVAKESCVRKSRQLARAKCDGAYGSNWRGERIEHRNDITCETKTIQDPDTGKIHNLLTNCKGWPIEVCIEGWESSHPGESYGSSKSHWISYRVGAKVGGKIMGIGVEVSGERAAQDTKENSYSVSWGGGKGYLAACDEGADRVAALCSDCSDVCKGRD